MKSIARVLLILFIAFLSTPALVSAIKKDCNTAMFFSMSEEEHALKEVKVYAYVSIAPQSIFGLLEINKSSLIQSENLSKHDNISASIFSPPPNLI